MIHITLVNYIRMILILICLIIKNIYKAIDIIHFFQAGIIIMRIKIFRLLFTMNRNDRISVDAFDIQFHIDI